MERFVLFTVNGLTLGAIYAAIALSLVLIWRSTRVLNFAQGAQGAAAVYVAWSVTDATGSHWIGLAAGVVAGALLGGLLQQVAFRRAESMPPMNTVIVGVGLLILIEAVLAMIFPIDDTRTVQPAFSTESMKVGDLPLASPQDLFVLAAVVLTMIGIGLLMTRTSVGLELRASALAPEISRLLGVRVSRMSTLGWALSGAAVALAGLLYMPTAVELVPTAMDGIFILGFTAAVVGGLDSPVGAVIGGLACGLALSYTSGYGEPTLLHPVAFVLLITTLLVRPEGLFSPAKTRKI